MSRKKPEPLLETEGTIEAVGGGTMGIGDADEQLVRIPADEEDERAAGALLYDHVVLRLYREEEDES